MGTPKECRRALTEASTECQRVLTGISMERRISPEALTGTLKECLEEMEVRTEARKAVAEARAIVKRTREIAILPENQREKRNQTMKPKKS